uniref:Menorin-like domain-containing protein n=2 Tax=Emiliania huxleyi TaxID=2903 RepID=A0A7S3RFS5_EMIHU|mmetsp:Transcript_6080/g.19158  ORF Transcript_6080/g.19158 Transcript_6080/m.19158 type:complete len:317 (-) Transcript_6080:124-1074(-)
MASSALTPAVHHPRASQLTWAHSCCSCARLERALSSPHITAIESDIIMAAGRPVMAHPPARSSDLTFEAFLDACIADGHRHLKLDFKVWAAVEPCLELLAARKLQLLSNGQAVWLNADIVPGPNSRKRVAIPADSFLPLCRQHCPWALLSLGWAVRPLGPDEAYTAEDVHAMEELCARHSLPGEQVVFSASFRFAEQDLDEVAYLLRRVPGAQLLLWTGTGEVPILDSSLSLMRDTLQEAGVGDRCGFDVALAATASQRAQARVVDCSFWLSRVVRVMPRRLAGLGRRLCCCMRESVSSRTGEMEPLVEIEIVPDR